MHFYRFIHLQNSYDDNSLMIFSIIDLYYPQFSIANALHRSSIKIDFIQAVYYNIRMIMFISTTHAFAASRIRINLFFDLKIIGNLKNPG